jgi:hypothetical protein
MTWGCGSSGLRSAGIHIRAIGRWGSIANMKHSVLFETCNTPALTRISHAVWYKLSRWPICLQALQSDRKKFYWKHTMSLLSLETPVLRRHRRFQQQSYTAQSTAVT